MTLDLLIQSGSNQVSPLVPPLLTGFFGLLGTIVGVLYQRKSEHYRQVSDNIYRPIFNELSNVSGGDLPYDPDQRRFHSYWSDLDWYWKSKVDENLRNDLTEYRNNLETLNTVLEIIAEELISNRSQLGDLWNSRSGHGDSEYIENKLLIKQNQTGSRKTHQPIIIWLSEYSDALFKSTDFDELKSGLKNTADEKSPEHRRAIDEWSDQDLVIVGEAINEANQSVSFPSDISSVPELTNRVENEAEELANRVEKKPRFLIFSRSKAKTWVAKSLLRND